jgi:hypothetical protein
MESNGLQEVMACVAVEDMDFLGWLEEGVVHLTLVHDHFGVDVDVNNHVPCVDVGTTFEERGPKEVKEQVLRKRRLMGGSQMGLDQMESDGLQEVMACIAVEDTDYAERLEEQPKRAQLKVKEVVDISVHTCHAYIG